jgi:hypothetical protein
MQMLSQNDLARRFADGATSGQASNVKIQERDNATLLVGYGHAVYAAREKATGEITVFSGWQMRESRRWAGSPSTKSQFGKMGLTDKADHSIAYAGPDTRAERSTFQRADATTDVPLSCAPKSAAWDDGLMGPFDSDD